MHFANCFALKSLFLWDRLYTLPLQKLLYELGRAMKASELEKLLKCPEIFTYSIGTVKD